MEVKNIVKVLDKEVKAKSTFAENIRHVCALYNQEVGIIAAETDVILEIITASPIIDSFLTAKLTNDFMTEIVKIVQNEQYAESDEAASLKDDIKDFTITEYKFAMFTYHDIKFEGYCYA